jgi:hypothetical protein
MVGDIVNLSARLMAAAKTGILTDNDTYDASKERIEFTKLEPIRVKGNSWLCPWELLYKVNLCPFLCMCLLNARRGLQPI